MLRPDGIGCAPDNMLRIARGKHSIGQALHWASRAQGTRKLIAESKNRSQGSRGIEGQSEKKIEANHARRSDLIGQR